MIFPTEAYVRTIYCKDNVVSKLKNRVNKEIFEAIENSKYYCLVPVKGYEKEVINTVRDELISTYGYLVGRRFENDVLCLYVKWGHARNRVSKDSEED